jgi:periplasmic protein TonB
LKEPPIYIGADTIMFEKISLIRYPSIAAEYGISGTVFISFIIDKNGKTSNHRVFSGIIGYGCDEEALKIEKYTR